MTPLRFFVSGFAPIKIGGARNSKSLMKIPRNRSIRLRLLQSSELDNIGGIFSAHIDVEVFFSGDDPSHGLRF